MDKKYSDFQSRLLAHSISALIVILLVLFSLFCPFRLMFGLIISIIALIALCEYYSLVRKKKVACATFLGCFFSFIYLFCVLLKIHPEIVLGVATFSLFIHFATKKEAILGLAASLFGLLYVIVPFGCIIRIATQFQGPSNGFWLVYLILVTKSADMGGYFIGRTYGRFKLAKNLSPNKTVEGALGGIAASIAMALLLLFVQNRYLHIITDFSYALSAVWGCVLGIFALMGDLAESLLKRDAKVKDSNKIRGVGGILDVVDALLFTAPVLYLFIHFHYNI